MNDAPLNDSPDDVQKHTHRPLWTWLLIIPILAAPFALDLGITYIQYKRREAQILNVIRPGMTEKEVLRALDPLPVVTGIGNDTYYIETKIRRPLTFRAIIWSGQKLKKFRDPWRTLLPLEMCLVKMDEDQKVKTGDFAEPWLEIPFR